MHTPDKHYTVTEQQPSCLNFRHWTSAAGYYCVLLCLLWCSSPILTFSPGLFWARLDKKRGRPGARYNINIEVNVTADEHGAWVGFGWPALQAGPLNVV